MDLSYCFASAELTSAMTGYKHWSLMRASAVVKSQRTLLFAPFRAASQASTSVTSVGASPMRRRRHSTSLLSSSPSRSRIPTGIVTCPFDLVRTPASSAVGLGEFLLSDRTGGAIVALDPDIPPARQRIGFAADAGSVALRWQLDGRDLGAATPRLWEPRPGLHRLALVDGKRAPVGTVAFVVRGPRGARHGVERAR